MKELKGRALVNFIANPGGKVDKRNYDEAYKEYYADDTITKEDIFEVLYEKYKDDEEAIDYLKFEEKQKDKMSLHDVKGLITGMYLYTM